MLNLHLPKYPVKPFLTIHLHHSTHVSSSYFISVTQPHSSIKLYFISILLLRISINNIIILHLCHLNNIVNPIHLYISSLSLNKLIFNTSPLLFSQPAYLHQLQFQLHFFTLRLHHSTNISPTSTTLHFNCITQQNIIYPLMSLLYFFIVQFVFL